MSITAELSPSSHGECHDRDGGGSEPTRAPSLGHAAPDRGYGGEGGEDDASQTVEDPQVAGAGGDARDAGHRRVRLGDAQRRRRRGEDGVPPERRRGRRRHGQLDLVVRRDRSDGRVRPDARRRRDHPAHRPAAATRRAGPLDGGGARGHRAWASGPDARFAGEAVKWCGRRARSTMRASGDAPGPWNR